MHKLQKFTASAEAAREAMKAWHESGEHLAKEDFLNLLGKNEACVALMAEILDNYGAFMLKDQRQKLVGIKKEASAYSKKIRGVMEALGL